MTEKFRRARSDVQKTERRSQILEATKEIIQQEGVDAVTMTRIAATTAISKAAFYRYFKSKEEIFAFVLIAQADEMTHQLRLHASRESRLDRFAIRFAETCAENPVFCILATDLARMLEPNIELDRLVEVKRGFNQILQDWVVMMLEEGIVTKPDIATQFIRSAYVVLAGLWPATQSRPTVKEAMRQAGMTEGFSSFEAEYAQLLQHIANGLTPEGDCT